MNKTFRLVMLTVLGLASCTAAPTPKSVLSIVPTALSTATVLSTATYIASFTPSKVPTKTPTLSPTLSPEQYPNLADVALKYEDIPSDDINHLFFENVLIKDISEDMRSQFDCSLDCHGELWSIHSFSISIMLIKLRSNDYAYKLLEDTCLKAGNNPFTLDVAGHGIVNYDDCIRVTGTYISDPPPNMWILPVSRKEALLGSTVGSVFVFIRTYQAYPSDYFNDIPLIQFAGYQTEKMIKFGIPANP